MADQIKSNLFFLCQNISNLEQILVHLAQTNIISENEYEYMLTEKIPFAKNAKLLTIIRRKSSVNKKKFLTILRHTNNGHCADVIEGIQTESRRRRQTHSNLHNTQWWLEKKLLIESLYKRKREEEFLVDVLHGLLQNDINRMSVICETKNASKLTGMGGMGKTVTAKWYANHYENHYDHILWMDCGEDSLIKSFQNLARDLIIENRNEILEVEEFARKCYQELKQFKCLWIFDNAENYKGKDGIQNILPKGEENFYCLITSRSLDWGTQNVGYGQISKLELDIFSDEESLNFLNQVEIKGTRGQLLQLCKLLDNLPLALQLTAAALKNNKINLEEYITKTNQVESITNVEFDDYEKTIHKNVSVSLELISEEKYGKIALSILNTLAYIRPDGVQSAFFRQVTNAQAKELLVAIEVLGKYSLITKSDKLKKDEKDLLSVHRLLQQVIRYNAKTTKKTLINRLLQQVIRSADKTIEKETLRRILSCEGFLDYKLIPFTKYADEDLRQEFPAVKAQLLDQQQLLKLLKEERFDDCVELARFIDTELKTNTTAFNYSICLDKSGQYEEAAAVLEKLYSRDFEESVDYEHNYYRLGILDLEGKVSKQLVAGHLLSIHFKSGNKEKVEELLVVRKCFQCIFSEEFHEGFLRILNSDVMTSNYSLNCWLSTILLTLGGEEKKIDFYSNSSALNIALPIDLKELKLRYIQLKDGNKEMENPDFSEWIPKKVNKLSIDNTNCNLSWERLSSIQYLSLRRCSVDLDCDTRISPTELEMFDVSFLKDGQQLQTVHLNDFIDFHQMNRLQLCCVYNIAMTIDLSAKSIQMDYLYLHKMTVLNWREAKWTVNHLELSDTSFVEKTQMTMKEVKVWNSLLDISCLPSSLRKLGIGGQESVECSGEVDLPNLTHLDLKSSGVPPSLFTAAPLTHISFNCTQEVNVDLLPPTVQQIKVIRRFGVNPTAVGGVRKVDKLILCGFHLNGVEQFLDHFQPAQLVTDHSYSPNEVMSLMYREMNTFAIGRVDWSRESFQESILSKCVDRESGFYLFERVKGKALEREELKEMKKLQWT